MQRLNVALDSRLKALTWTSRPLLKTRHAKERAASKGVQLPDTLTIAAGMVVELERDFGNLTKLVVRFPLDSKRDMVLVLVPADSSWLVVTAWTNTKADTHRTLNKARLSA